MTALTFNKNLITQGKNWLGYNGLKISLFCGRSDADSLQAVVTLPDNLGYRLFQKAIGSGNIVTEDPCPEDSVISKITKSAKSGLLGKSLIMRKDALDSASFFGKVWSKPYLQQSDILAMLEGVITLIEVVPHYESLLHNLKPIAAREKIKKAKETLPKYHEILTAIAFQETRLKSLEDNYNVYIAKYGEDIALESANEKRVEIGSIIARHNEELKIVEMSLNFNGTVISTIGALNKLLWDIRGIDVNHTFIAEDNNVSSPDEKPITQPVRDEFEELMLRKKLAKAKAEEEALAKSRAK